MYMYWNIYIYIYAYMYQSGWHHTGPAADAWNHIRIIQTCIYIWIKRERCNMSKWTNKEPKSFQACVFYPLFILTIFMEKITHDIQKSSTVTYLPICTYFCCRGSDNISVAIFHRTALPCAFQAFNAFPKEISILSRGLEGEEGWKAI